MANKFMKKFSTLSVIVEMHIKTITRCHYTPVRMPKIFLKLIIPSVIKDAEQLEHSYNDGGNANWYSHFGKQLGSFLRSQIYPYHINCQSHSQYLPKRNENLCTHTAVCNVYRSFIHNHKKMETTQMSFN